MIAKIHPFQDETASHQKNTLHVVAGDAVYVVTRHAEEDVVVDSEIKVQAAIDGAISKEPMQVRSLVVARSRT